MTADVMEGVREKCHESGMNDYITKPINPDELFSTLLKWIKPGVRKVLSEPAKEKTDNDLEQIPTIQGIDAVSGLKRVGNNRKLYKNLLYKFKRDFANSPQELRTMAARRDWDTSQLLAHTVKGVAGNIGAKGIGKSAADLERILRDRDLKSLAEKLRIFEADLALIVSSINAAFPVDAGLETKKDKKPKGDLHELLRNLSELKVHAKKRKPRLSKSIITEIKNFSWQEDLTQKITELDKLTSRYKFKDALLIIDSILNILNNK